MNWRWAWAKARVTPVVLSAMVWLIVLALWPAVVGIWVLTSIVVVASWNSRWALRLRFGARPMLDADRDAVLRSLILVQAFRGRGQPELWVGGRSGAGVVAPDMHLLIVDQRLLVQVRRGTASDLAVCTQAARALGLLPAHRSRAVATVSCFTLPWRLAATALRPLGARNGQSPAARFVWQSRWVFVGLATMDLACRGLWISLSMLVLAATATVTTPRWDRDWADRLARIADAEAARHGLGSSRGGSTQPTAPPNPSLGVTHQTGRR